MHAAVLVSLCSWVAKLQVASATRLTPPLHPKSPLLHGSKVASPLGTVASKRISAPRLQEAVPALGQDLVGDAGVFKSVITPGSGVYPQVGSEVEVHYEGRLQTGEVFDSSRARGKPFKFKLGEGRVIGGWEVALSVMQVGERAEITCMPRYAYGDKGVPPMIPPDAQLIFDMELISLQLPRGIFDEDDDEALFGGEKGMDELFDDILANNPKTRKRFDKEFDKFRPEESDKESGLGGLGKKILGGYYFGFMDELDPGKKPPWFLTPTITFPIVIIFCGILFWIVYACGAIKTGENPNDLKDIIDSYDPNSKLGKEIIEYKYKDR